MKRISDEEIAKVIRESNNIQQILGRRNTHSKKYNALITAQLASDREYLKSDKVKRDIDIILVKNCIHFNNSEAVKQIINLLVEE